MPRPRKVKHNLEPHKTKEKANSDELQLQLIEAYRKAESLKLELAAFKRLYEIERKRYTEYKEKIEVELAQARRLRSVIQDALSPKKTAT